MTTDDLAQRFFDHEMTQQAADYVGRGRALEQCSDQAVLDIWAGALETWYRHRSTENRIAHDDVDAELRLRGLEAPHSKVAGILAALRSEAKRLDAVMGHRPPPPGLVDRVKTFLMGLEA